MKPLPVVITEATLARLRPELDAALGADFETRWCHRLPAAEQGAALADAAVLVGPRFDVATAAAAPVLRLLQVPGAGTDGIDPEAVRAHRAQAAADGGAQLLVANAYHHETAIAEYAIWATVALRRRLHAADQALRADRWLSPGLDSALPLPRSLEGARVGFVGFGHIGQRCWQAFRAFGASGHAVTGSAGVDAAAAGLHWAGGTDQLLRACSEAEILVVSPPLTEATRGLIGADQLAALGPDGIIVNVARGPVVAPAALYRALATNSIAGAALDVWYRYPSEPGALTRPAEQAFGELDNVLMTPHISGVVEQTLRGRVATIADNLRRLRSGEPLRNRIEIG